MNFIKITVSFFISTLIFQSCGVHYGYYVNDSFAKITDEPCLQKWEGVYLFFEGEELPFTYKKIGLVQAESPENGTASINLDYLKAKAWSNCANGIISIKDNYKTRTSGNYLDAESEEVYSSQVYSGIAVKIDIDSAFISKYGYLRDTSFVTRVHKMKYREKESEKKQVVGTTIAYAIGIIVAVVYLSKPIEEN